jgi:hypothetical protein
MAVSKLVRAGIVASLLGLAVAAWFGYSSRPSDELGYYAQKDCMSPLDRAENYDSIEKELEERVARNDTPASVKEYLVSWGMADQLHNLKPEAFQKNADLLLISIRGLREADCQIKVVAELSRIEHQYWYDFVSTVLKWLVIGWVILLFGRLTVRWIWRGE